MHLPMHLSFNRTFMELKYLSLRVWYKFQHCFNRTFMELKFDRVVASALSEQVSIVPLWN